MAKARAYLEWVCDQACCVSHRQGEGVQAHHIKGYDQQMARKPSDLLTIPLFHELHRELHDGGWRAFEEKHGINQQTEVLKMISRAHDEGILVIRRL